MPGELKMEYEWEKDRKGLFIIVRQTVHRLRYHPIHSKSAKTNWGERKTLDYGPDEQRVLKTFQLTHRPTHLIIGENLTNTKGRDCFDKFMKKKVCGYSERTGEVPAFVMFFLMTHGFENGDFLLAEHGTKVLNPLKKAKHVSKKPCCKGQKDHQLERTCFGRNVFTHIIDKICQSFPGVPKVFVFQCCRGTAEGCEGDGNPVPPTKSSIQSLVPSQPDVIIFQSAVEGHASYATTKESGKKKVTKSKNLLEGSFFLQSFCKSVTELISTSNSYKKLLDVLQGQAHTNSQIVVPLSRREDLTGGWIMNVFQRTSSLATNYMLRKYIISDKTLIGKLVNESEEHLESQFKTDENRLRQRLVNCLHPALQQVNISQGDFRLVVEKSRDHPWQVLMYLWHNVQTFTPRKELDIVIPENEKTIMKNALNDIIRKIQKPAHRKQQPHISSSLAKKLSFIKILESQGVC